MRVQTFMPNYLLGYDGKQVKANYPKTKILFLPTAMEFWMMLGQINYFLKDAILELKNLLK